jgi:hypothetical protein
MIHPALTLRPLGFAVFPFLFILCIFLSQHHPFILSLLYASFLFLPSSYFHFFLSLCPLTLRLFVLLPSVLFFYIVRFRKTADSSSG